MKKNKLQRLATFLWIALSLLLFGLIGAVILLVYPNFGKPLDATYSLLFFLDGIFLFLLSASIAILLALRQRLIEERRSSNEFFSNERFVFTEANLKSYLTKKAKRNKLHGILAAIVVKDINSELLTLYGSDTVREINEMCLGCISWRFGSKPDCRYAYNMLDGFFVYKDTENADAFYDELKDVAVDIAEKLHQTAALPSVKILIGAYLFTPEDTIDQSFQKTTFAQKFNAASRLTDDVVVYNQEMMAHNQAQRDLAIELDSALQKEEFEIYYQPKYRLKDKSFYGAEALIRWHHPTRGLLQPSLFIPFAEASGNITFIDYYVFEHVCRNIDEWRAAGVPILTISVNLSRKTIYNPGLLEYFLRTVKKHNIDPRLLEIELTESIAAKDSIFISDIIMKLRRSGFMTAIDDFGIGYSSFASLKRISFDTLKVDKTFIDDIEVNERGRSMVRMVIDLGHSLGMNVVAEGVQSLRQSQILQSLKLDNIQGFYYSRPLSGFDYVRFLHDHKVSPRPDSIVQPKVETAPAEEEEYLSPEEARAISRSNLKRGRGSDLQEPVAPTVNEVAKAPEAVSTPVTPVSVAPLAPEPEPLPVSSAKETVEPSNAYRQVPNDKGAPALILVPAPLDSSAEDSSANLIDPLPSSLKTAARKKEPFNPIVNLRKKPSKDENGVTIDSKKTEGDV